MQRTGETFEKRYEAELVLIELFALLVLLFLLSTGAAPGPVSHSVTSPPVQPMSAPAKPVEQPTAAPAKPTGRHVAKRRVVVSIPDRKLAGIGGRVEPAADVSGQL